MTRKQIRLLRALNFSIPESKGLICPELLNYNYDFDTNKTRNYEQFIKDKKGICYDFVNYIYYKLNKKPKCYFIYGNKTNDTHTFCIYNGIWIEYAWQNHKGERKSNVNDIALLFAKEHNKNDTNLFLVEYKPDNKIQTINEFCENKFKYKDDKLIDVNSLNFSILDFFKRKKKEDKKKPVDDELDEESPTSSEEVRWFLEDIRSIIQDKCKIKNIHIYTDPYVDIDKLAKIYTKYYDTILKQAPALYKQHERWWKKMLPKCREMHAERFGVHKDQVLPWGGINIGITLLNNNIGISFEHSTFDNTDEDQGLFFTTRFDGNGKLVNQEVEI